jgi:hypothetical protein
MFASVGNVENLEPVKSKEKGSGGTVASQPVAVCAQVCEGGEAVNFLRTRKKFET